MKLRKQFWFLLAIGSVSLPVVFAGCPDYSHLRDIPDYVNQKDPDSGEANVKAPPLAQPPEEERLDDDGRNIE